MPMGCSRAHNECRTGADPRSSNTSKARTHKAFRYRGAAPTEGGRWQTRGQSRRHHRRRLRSWPAAAQLFSAEGAKVAIVDIDSDRAEQTLKLVTEDGGDAIAITADVSDKAQITAAIDQTVDHYGKLDIAWANAGIVSRGGAAALGPRGSRRVRGHDRGRLAATFSASISAASSTPRRPRSRT